MINTAKSKHAPDGRQISYYNRHPFHLDIELEKELVTRISFLSPDHPGYCKQSSRHPYCQLIGQYLDGSVSTLDIPHKLSMSHFTASVYDAAIAIPYGKIATYAQIAVRIGKPKAARAVGSALASNPLPLIIPCHRVIGSNGKLTGFAGGLEIKRLLLELEQGK